MRLFSLLVPLMLLGLSVAPNATQAQDYRTGAFGFQTIAPYPAVHALGEATVAADGMLGFADVNPAAIGEAGFATLGTPFSTGGTGPFASEWFPASGEDMSFATPVVTMRMGRWAGALHLKRFHAVEPVQAPVPDYFPSPEVTPRYSTVNVDAREYRLGGAVAYEMSEGVRVGMGLNYIRTQADGRPSVSSMNVDLGVLAAREVDAGAVRLRPTFGASLVGFGPRITNDTFDRGREGQETMFRIGTGLQAQSVGEWAPGLPLFQGALYASLGKRLAGGTLGVNGREPFGPFEALVQAWGEAQGVVGPDGQPATASAWDQITRHVGLSATLFDVLTLRTGRRFASNRAILRPSFTAVGVGLDLDYVRVDYAATVADDGGAEDQSYLRFTARIPLAGASSPLWARLLSE